MPSRTLCTWICCSRHSQNAASRSVLAAISCPVFGGGKAADPAQIAYPDRRGIAKRQRSHAGGAAQCPRTDTIVPGRDTRPRFERLLLAASVSRPAQFL